jgi:ATP-dependent Clp protease ATP-binding subunit ClpA
LRLEDVHHVLSDWTGIDPAHMRAGRDIQRSLRSLPERLRERIVGQNEAICDAVSALRRKLQLKPELRGEGPVATLLFAGPSGVGKTETARQIAGHFYGSKERFLKRIDLSEFTAEHTAARLLGSPPGYVGHGQGGELVNALKDERHGLLLLDEVEKAHPTVLTDALLPLLGSGTVHEMGTGREVDASNYLVVMTSNLGTNRHLETSEQPANAASKAEERISKAARSSLPNEFLGRIDEITVFHPLGREEIRKIWDLRLKEFEQKLSRQYDGFSGIDVARSCRDLLLERAQENVPAEGARAVQKVIDRIVAARSLELVGGGPPSTGIWSIQIEQAEGDLRFVLQTEED